MSHDPGNAVRTASLIAGVLLALPILGQEKPLERTFVAGEAHRYRVELTVRSALEGQQTEGIGAKTYVTPFTRSAGATLSWTATRRVIALRENGAEIEETLESFSAVSFDQQAAAGDPGQLTQLREALGRALARLKGLDSRALRYTETATGQLRGVSPESAPLLDEPVPQVLAAWLLRALRPVAALPAHPLKFGHRWQEPREAQLPNWSEIHATESGEWLAAPDAREPAARLHLVQQIAGKVFGGADRPKEGTAEARFHGESLALISLGDGRMLSATRSASREITWTLAPVPGLPEPPRFRGRLSLEIRIEEIE